MSQAVITAKRPGLIHLGLMVMAAYDIISDDPAALGKAGLLAVRKFFDVILLAIALKVFATNVSGFLNSLEF